MDAEERFGKVLRELRRQKGLSQEDLAFAAGVNRQFVSLLELNERSPSLATLYKLAAGLEMTGSELLQRLEAPMPLVQKIVLKKPTRKKSGRARSS